VRNSCARLIRFCVQTGHPRHHGTTADAATPSHPECTPGAGGRGTPTSRAGRARSHTRQVRLRCAFVQRSAPPAGRRDCAFCFRVYFGHECSPFVRRRTSICLQARTYRRAIGRLCMPPCAGSSATRPRSLTTCSCHPLVRRVVIIVKLLS
jgi:hypothetical protein